MSDIEDPSREPGRDEYLPAAYWSDRLAANFSLRGVGHGGYSERYNRWIYRQKARVLAKALPPLTPGGAALDAGSGIGWVVDQLNRAGWQTRGCDISELAVERLRERFPGNEFFQLALGEDPPPLEPGSLDLITLLDVSYHIVDDQLWARGVADLSRLLKPGGHLVVLDRFGGQDDDAAAHVRFRSLDRWTAAASSSGLRIEAVEPAYRWLSRERSGLGWVRERARGPLEFALETLVPRQPHMRCARFVATTGR